MRMKKYHRHSIRLPGYDYSQPSYYFVTICVQDMKELFGVVRNGEMVLNEIGQIIDKWWRKISDKFDMIDIDEYQIMPNHLHGIINIAGADPCVCPCNIFNVSRTRIGRTRGSAPTLTIGTVIQWFKTMSTSEYIRNVKNKNWPLFNKHLWQRNYYDHIIRNDGMLHKIRKYIVNNPMKWEFDEYNRETQSCRGTPIN